MPNRCQANVHDAHYKWIAARDGEHCLACFIERGVQKKGKLQIDHANNDITDWSPKNLHLLCQTHNLKMRALTTQQHINLMRQYSARNERKREKIRGGEAEDIVSAVVDYTSGSPEMQVNVKCRKGFTDWTLGIINKYGSWPKKDIINSGAHVAGCNTQTSRRYLDALTGSVGPLQETRDETGTVVISFRKR